MSTMQRIPAHAEETKTFTPAALLNEKAPPKFVLKAVSRREREAMQYAMAEEGLVQFNDERMREVAIEEFCRLWKCDPQDEKIERIRTYWQALDEYVDQARANRLEIEEATAAGDDPPPPLGDFSHPDEKEIDGLMERLDEASPTVRKMRVSNVRFQRELSRFAVAHAVTDWTGLPTPPQFEAGLLSLESVVALSEELAEQFGKEKGGIAFLELSMEAIRRIYLDKDAEKNSSSPAPSQPTPQATKEPGSAETNGSSPASASSDATPDA